LRGPRGGSHLGLGPDLNRFRFRAGHPGTMSSGQGHETSFAQLVTEWLGVPFDSISYVAHDTARVDAGGGPHSGRSMKLATTIIGKASRQSQFSRDHPRNTKEQKSRILHRPCFSRPLAITSTKAASTPPAATRRGRVTLGPRVCGLVAGGRRIRTRGPALPGNRYCHRGLFSCAA
jgi:hypothetical protein